MLRSAQETEEEDDGISVSSRLFGFLLLGIALVFVGIIILVVATLVFSGSASVGGIILIGPIPIVFGAGPEASWLIVISIILSVLSIVLFLVMNRRLRRFSG